MHRSKPFSGKKKRQQLQAKREKKRQQEEQGSDDEVPSAPPTAAPGEESVTDKTNAKPAVCREPTDPNRLRTVFDTESREEVERRKTAGRDPLDTTLRDEISESLLSESLLPIPLRPAFNAGETKEEQEKKEEVACAAWRERLREVSPERLNYFEQNIEVWRQLWRTLERSDIILLLTDARYPLFHFPPALYDYVVNVIKKPLVLVFNKRDLVAPEIVAMWQAWFAQRYPGVKTVPVASFRAPLDGTDALAAGRKRQLAKGRKRYESAEGLEDLIEIIRSIGIKKQGVVIPIPPFRRPPKPAAAKPAAAGPATETKGKKESIEETKSAAESAEKDDDESAEGSETDSGDDESERSSSVEEVTAELESMALHADGKPKLGQMGTVGHPNVGKSSLINGLMGRKVVSTSRTPGHTKHFQTIFLSPELQLMDCPGLVFPALDRPKALQVLCGLYPLAQVREFFSPLRYLAERVPIEHVYALRLPPDTHRWTPWAIAEALALQRGYTLARGGRPDVHRAGREILTDCLDGRIVFSWPPPGFEEQVREFLRKEAEARAAALLTPPPAVRADETEEEAEQRRAAKREKKAEARKLKRLGPGHAADPRAVQRVLQQVAAAKEEDAAEATEAKPAGKASKESERAREYAERQAAKQGRRKRGDGPLDL